MGQKYEVELEYLLNRDKFLKLKPKPHPFLWLAILITQKEDSYIGEKKLSFNINNIYHEKYSEKLDTYCETK